MKLKELLKIYQTDCDVECEKCPLGKPVVEHPAPAVEGEPDLPNGFTLCDLFDYINLNKEE